MEDLYLEYKEFLQYNNKRQKKKTSLHNGPFSHFTKEDIWIANEHNAQHPL